MSEPADSIAAEQSWRTRMSRSTPPRPVDIEAVFRALTAHRRTATRLHPRPGVPRAEDVGTVLTPQPEPPVAGRVECVPTPCVLHPEQVVEHQYLGLLGDDLQEQIAEWEESLLGDEDADDTEDGPDSTAPASYASYAEYEAATAAARAAEPDEIDYMSDLSLAPGWKVGGYASWHLTDPAPVDCPRCATSMPPLLTVDTGECDGGSRSWLPLEDDADDPGVIDPVGTYLGRGQMRIHICPTDPTHPHRLTFQ
ncbi:hypothetical protein [Streptomyces sp. NPDC019507]|uniref:hypothetical protein n=1 Tax=Streptomyces sp. NPDC019507 TaxID=3154689 RepID=UPI00340E3CFD